MTSPLHQALPPSATVSRFPLERLGDASLLQAALRGEATAMGLLWDRHAAMVRRILSSVLGPDAAVEEVLKDVFLSLVQGACPHSRGLPMSFVAYSAPSGASTSGDAMTPTRSQLLALAVSRLGQELRRRRLGQWLRRPFTCLHDRGPFRRSDARLLGNGGAESAVQTFYRQLDRLGHRERLVFALRVIAGLDVAEVARALGWSEPAVERALASATRTLERSFHGAPLPRAQLRAVMEEGE